ncbi:MAG TPA: hypothetical protein VMV61_15720 [Patescibacteria group bacterium]|nr:hypothetical protein [Patescibacteria group bacterium]
MSKLLKFLILSLLVLAMSSPAWADDIKVIFDPVPASTYYGAYEINQQGVNYAVSFGSCNPTANPSISQATTLINYVSANDEGGTLPSGCMALVNFTGAPIMELDLTITGGIPGDTETLCQSLDSFLVNATCSGSLDAGMVSVSFNGGNAIPPSTQNSFSVFYLGEIGVDPSMITTGVTAPSYDPSTLVLLLAGMTLLGVYGTRRYA